MTQYTHLKGETYAYILDCAGKCKIGIARDTYTRIAHMQMNCPLPIKLSAERLFGTRDEARMVERDLHAQFADKRLWGEWFDVAASVACQALASHEGQAAGHHFQQPTRPAVLEPARRPKAPAPRPKPFRPRQRPEGPRPTFDEMEAMHPDERVEWLRDAARALEF